MSSVTRAKSDGRTRRDAVRGQVLAATERLLGDGERFTALGVGRISETAGVARSAFYTNFADKSDLLMALTEHATEQLFTSSLDWIARRLGAEPDELSATLLGSLTIFRDHAAVLTAYAEVAAYDPVVARFWTSRIEQLVAALQARIVTGQETGEFRTDLEPRATAEFIVWGAERSMSQHVAHTDACTDAAFADNMARSVAAMLYAPR